MNNKITKALFHIFIIGIICLFCAKFLGPNSEYNLFANFFVLVILPVLYGIFNKTWNTSNSMLFAISIVLVFIFMNHYYSHDVLIQALPWLHTNNGMILIYILATTVCIIICTPFIAKVLNKKRIGIQLNAKKSSENKEVNSDSREHANEQIPSHPITSNDSDKISIGIKQLKEILDSGKNRMPQVLIFVILILVVAVVIIYFFGIVENPADFEQKWLFEMIMACAGYAALVIIIGLIIIVVISIFMEVIMILYKRLNQFKSPKSRAGKTEKAETALPTLSFSALIIIASVWAYSKATDTSLNKLYDLFSEGHYFALPLAVLFAIVVFAVFISIIKGIMELLFDRETGEKVKNNIHDIGNKIISIIFDTILAILKFIRFIPDFFTSLSCLVLEEEKNKKGGKKDAGRKK